jgi:hypothetical protein
MATYYTDDMEYAMIKDVDHEMNPTILNDYLRKIDSSELDMDELLNITKSAKKLVIKREELFTIIKNNPTSSWLDGYLASQNAASEEDNSEEDVKDNSEEDDIAIKFQKENGLPMAWGKYVTNYIIWGHFLFQDFPEYELQLCDEVMIFGSPQAKSKMFITSIQQSLRFESVEELPDELKSYLIHLKSARPLVSKIKSGNGSVRYRLFFSTDIQIGNEKLQLQWDGPMNAKVFTEKAVSSKFPLVVTSVDIPIPCFQ